MDGLSSTGGLGPQANALMPTTVTVALFVTVVFRSRHRKKVLLFSALFVVLEVVRTGFVNLPTKSLTFI